MKKLEYQAPAKLNLSLRVLRRREDGFHEIDTLMVRLPGLADWLTLEEAAGFSFVCDDPSLPAGEGNLVVKAARAYERALGNPLRVAVGLGKRVPHGAGLGGGSSDAATALAALDEWHGGVLGRGKLLELAAELGSDLPFFLGRGAARCLGRGERIEPAEPVPPALPLLLLKPVFGVETPDAYRRWRDARAPAGSELEPQLFPWGELVNDLERPVFAKHLVLVEMKQWLRARPEVAGALMSGSGSTMFAILHRLEDAAELARAARHELDSQLWCWHGMSEGGIS